MTVLSLGGDESGREGKRFRARRTGREGPSLPLPIPEPVLSLRVQRKAMCPDLAQSWVGEGRSWPEGGGSILRALEFGSCSWRRMDLSRESVI